MSERIALPETEANPQEQQAKYTAVIAQLVARMRPYFPTLRAPRALLANDNATFQRLTGIDPTTSQVFAATSHDALTPTIIFSPDHARTMARVEGTVNASNQIEVLAYKTIVHELVHVAQRAGKAYREQDVIGESLAELWALVFCATRLPFRGSIAELERSLIATRFYMNRIDWMADVVIAITGGQPMFGAMTRLLNEQYERRVRELETTLLKRFGRLTLRNVQEIIATRPEAYPSEVQKLWEEIEAQARKARGAQNPIQYVMAKAREELNMSDKQTKAAMSPQEMAAMMRQMADALEAMGGGAQKPAEGGGYVDIGGSGDIGGYEDIGARLVELGQRLAAMGKGKAKDKNIPSSDLRQLAELIRPK